MTFKWDFLKLATVNLGIRGICFWHPQILSKVMNIVESDTMDTSEAGKQLLLLVFLKYMDFVVGHHNWYTIHKSCNKVYSSLYNLVYQKTLKLTPSTNKAYSTGEIQSLIHRDCGQLCGMGHELLDMMLLPIYLIYGVYYLFQELSKSCLSGLFFILL